MRSLAQLMDLSDRRALVTGGGGHIGGAVAEALVELGARTEILDCDEIRCKDRVECLLKIRPGSALPAVCDLVGEETTRKTIRQVIIQLGGLDIVVHHLERRNGAVKVRYAGVGSVA